MVSQTSGGTVVSGDVVRIPLVVDSVVGTGVVSGGEYEVSIIIVVSGKVVSVVDGVLVPEVVGVVVGVVVGAAVVAGQRLGQ